MDNPIYILYTNETVDMPKNKEQLTITDKFNIVMKKIVLVIIGIIILGSIFFHDNLLSDMSTSAKVIFVCILLPFIFKSNNISTPSPIEIWFYDTYLVVYREKTYYSKRVTRKEYNKFLYEDISSIEYNFNTKLLNFYGKIDATFYKYNKDGTLPTTPYYDRVTDEGVCFLYIYDNDEQVILDTIEKYINKKILLKNKKEV